MGETSQPLPADLARDSTALVQAVGQSLNMAALYGVQHKVTRSSLESSFPALARFLDTHGHLDMNVVDNGLLVNGQPAEAPLAPILASRLAGRDLLSFEINKGFSMEEYVALFTLLLAPPTQMQGPLTAQLNADGGFIHIQPRTVGYRRVVEGEATDAPATPPVPAASQPSPGQAVAAARMPDLDNVVAFLKNDTVADARRSADDIRQLAGDAEKLAELILRTVEVRASAANLAGGESLHDIVVGTIGKVVAELAPPQAVRTAKGRKQAKRSLMLLEGAVLQKLQKLAGDTTSATAGALIHETAANLDMETMAASFMKHRRAAGESGEKLRRIIAKASADPAHLKELHQDLTQHGLTEDGWQELLIQRHPEASAPAPVARAGMEDIKTLTMLLARLGDAIGQERQSAARQAAPAIRSIVEETSRQMASTASATERKIQRLRQRLHQEANESGSKLPALTRQELIEFLAEIGQELSQPLTVLSASIDMLKDQRAGLLTETQIELLGMAAESNKRLNHLVDCVIRIGGNPRSLQPDAALLSAIYDAPPSTRPSLT